MQTILITGVAGFIGFHMAYKLINEGYRVIGLDSITTYYDITLKHARLQQLGIEANKIIDNCFFESSLHKNFKFIKLDLEEDVITKNVFENVHLDYIIHLAGQAGVPYSIKNPRITIKSNILGFLTILELSKQKKIIHLIYASTSSVYGLNTEYPFKEMDNTSHPLTIYSATKKSNELMAHTYSHLFEIPTTGLRFFTVYGEWGRPDMAIFQFTADILNGNPIKLFNYGNIKRDFTYVDDIVNSIEKLILLPPKGYSDWNSVKHNQSISSAPFRILNIGNNNPVSIIEFVSAIEKSLKKQAIVKLEKHREGDLKETFADTTQLVELINYQPKTTINDGVNKFVQWYLSYFKISI